MEKCSCYEERVYYNPRYDMKDPVSICNGTKEQDVCNCRGYRARCDFYPEFRKKEVKKEETDTTTIYYAHHRWKYGTKVEEYELNLIKQHFPNIKIFNPSVDLKVDGRTEEDIMSECLDIVRNSDIIIFSSMDGVIGKGVYEEIMEARKNNKLILYIHNNRLITNWRFSRCLYEITKDDRIYASIEIL